MISALQAENEGLRTLLEARRSQLTPPPEERRTSRPAAVGGVSAHSPQVAKIALFRSLFRGRDDVKPAVRGALTDTPWLEPHQREPGSIR